MPLPRLFPCRYPGCTLSGVSGGDKPHHFCYGHGGGNLCTTEGCDTPARKGGLYKLHGGGKRCRKDECESIAQDGSNFCNKHGGGDRCEIPYCTNNTFRKRRCKKHQGTPMTEPEPETAPDLDYVEGFVIVSSMPEDPKPRNSSIPTLLHAINKSMNSSDPNLEALQHLRAQVVDQLQGITVSTNSKPNWQEICAMVNRAEHRQPTALLCNTAGCTRPAATTDDLVNSSSELQVTLVGRCKECTFSTKDWSEGHSATAAPSRQRHPIWGPYVD